MRHIIATWIVIGACRLMAQSAPMETPITLGSRLEFPSTLLHEQRVLNVVLPDGYDTSKVSYPVIVLLDGSANEDLVHVAGIIQFHNMMGFMGPCILVGVGNVDRRRDFTFPTNIKEDLQAYPTTGHSAAFIDFLEKEALPLVHSLYRTNGQRLLIGQSLGGLLATEILFTRPQLFNQYMIVSPSLWWDKESLLRRPTDAMKAADLQPTTVRVVVGKEGKVMENDAAALASLLKKLGQPKIEVSLHKLPKENHATILHPAVYEALPVLLPPPQGQ
ncbi:MAG: alpha/beta hydrolase-fold protein [Bacteroidia bacterium]